MDNRNKHKHINNLNNKIKKKTNSRLYCAKPEVNLCVSALGWWALGFGPDEWKHWNHSHRNKTHHLPNRNVLAVSLPHKQAFEGRWAGRRTDGRHSRVDTHSRAEPGRAGPRPNWERPEWVAGSQWKRKWGGVGVTTGAMHHQLFHKGWEKPGKKAGGQNHWNKMQIPTTWFTLETTDLITNHSAGYSRC